MTGLLGCRDTAPKQTSHPSVSRPWRLAVLTVEVWADGVPGQEAVDCNLINDVQQQERHTGETQGLQQTPCVAWSKRRKGRS